MPYNFVADSIHIKKLCSRLSSSEVHLKEDGHFCFGFLGAMYTVYLRLIGKRVVNFSLVTTELFRSVLRLRRYGRILIKN